MNQKRRSVLKGFDPSRPRRFAGNVLVLLALLLLIAWALDWSWSLLSDDAPIWCFAVDWLSTFGIGGALSLILAMTGVTALVLFRRRNAGVWFLVTAFGIWFMPSLLNAYFGIGKTCGAY